MSTHPGWKSEDMMPDKDQVLFKKKVLFELYFFIWLFQCPSVTILYFMLIPKLSHVSLLSALCLTLVWKCKCEDETSYQILSGISSFMSFSVCIASLSTHTFAHAHFYVHLCPLSSKKLSLLFCILRSVASYIYVNYLVSI